MSKAFSALLTHQSATVAEQFREMNRALEAASAYVMDAQPERRCLQKMRRGFLRAARFRDMNRKRRPL